jgi:hypothetical protein
MSKVQINKINIGNTANNNSVFIKREHIQNYKPGTILMRIHGSTSKGYYVNRILKVTTEATFKPGCVPGKPNYNYEIGTKVMLETNTPVNVTNMLPRGWSGVTNGNVVLSPHSTKFNRKMYNVYLKVLGLIIGRK